jgi:glycolate oxidase FAD binding subunit
MNQVIEHAWADLTVSVEAGCTMGGLQERLGKHRQRLALDALWPERATVGGVLSTNDSGALRLRFGSLRDLVIGVTLALADGTVASSGGKVVKNVAGYDLPKLVTGAFGTLGIITRAIFRLHPLPKETCTIVYATGSSIGAQEMMQAIQSSKLAHSAVQMRVADGEEVHVDILFEATEAGLTAQKEQLRNIVGTMAAADAGREVWSARQDLFPDAKRDSAGCAVAKLAILPAKIAEAIDAIAGASPRGMRWRAVVEATGIGWVRLGGGAAEMDSMLRALRASLEAMGGSLVILQRPTAGAKIDAWGNAGTALTLMRGVKAQFDAASTLNPGRFVGGI